MVITYKEIKNQKIETEERYKRESEILGKVVSEILLKYSEKVTSDWKRERTDEQITEILNQPDWRKKTDFVALWDKDKSEAYLGHRWSIPWIVSAREPIEIIERLNEERNEWISESIRLEKKVKELEKSNLWLQKELKEAWSEGDTHIEAMKYAGELAEAKSLKETEKLKTKLNDKSELLLQFIENLAKEKVKNDQKQKAIEQKQEELREIVENLEKEKRKNEELQRTLYLQEKPLPKIPSKIKVFKEKVKTKFKQFQQLAKKTKVKVQEFVARIEVKVK